MAKCYTCFEHIHQDAIRVVDIPAGKNCEGMAAMSRYGWSFKWFGPLSHPMFDALCLKEGEYVDISRELFDMVREQEIDNG